jgi:soluble lytic murein transglycosylase-like protein
MKTTRASIVALACAAAAYAQTGDFERSVRAAMAPSLAKQRASVQKQTASIVRTSGFSSDSFFDQPLPENLGVFAECDAMPAADLDKTIAKAARKEQVDPDLIRAVVEQESAAHPCAISFRGAQGLMQLMPGTAEELGVEDPFDPEQNIAGGTRFLKQLLVKYDGDVSLALSAYNAGPGRVDEEGGIPPIPETLNYVSEILRKLELKQTAAQQAPATPNRSTP